MYNPASTDMPAPFAGDSGEIAVPAASNDRPEGSGDVRAAGDSEAGTNYALAGSGPNPSALEVSAEQGVDMADGRDDTALQALVQRLPDLSYMLSDVLVLPAKPR
jgi:hypothetical protein